nr:immunoglobulin heavy chain junction region [Mus musculus]
CARTTAYYFDYW